MDSKRLAKVFGFVIVGLSLASLVLGSLPRVSHLETLGLRSQQAQAPARLEQPAWLIKGAVLRAHPDGGCEDCPSWLILTKGTISKKIAGMNDFRGFVEIKTAKDALSYCRFGDHDAKYPHSGGVEHAEIVPVQYPGMSRAWGSNVSKQTWKEAGMTAPKINHQGDSWVVTRAAIVGVGRAVKPYLIQETVGKDGSYSLKKLKPYKIKMGKNDSLYFDGLG